MNPIQGPSNALPLPPPSMSSGPQSAGGASFKNLFLEAIDHVNTMQQDADKAVTRAMESIPARVAADFPDSYQEVFEAVERELLEVRRRFAGE